MEGGHCSLGRLGSLGALGSFFDIALWVPWWVTEQICSDADGSYIVQAVGDLCETDGTTMEIWPMLTKDEVVQKVVEDPEFKADWQKVRAGVAAAEKKAFLKQQFVESRAWTGYEISRKMAFVHEGEFNTKVGVQLGGPGCTAERITLHGYGRNKVPVVGAVLEFNELPSNVQFEKVKVFSGADRVTRAELLNPGNTFRVGQAQDRFRFAVDKFKMPFSGLPGTGKEFKTLKDEADRAQAQLHLQNQAEVNNAGVARSVITQCSSMLAEDDDAAGEGVAVSAGKKGGRASGPAVRGAAARAASVPPARAGGRLLAAPASVQASPGGAAAASTPPGQLLSSCKDRSRDKKGSGDVDPSSVEHHFAAGPGSYSSNPGLLWCGFGC